MTRFLLGTGGAFGLLNQTQINNLINYAFTVGINSFDTGSNYGYGRAETLLGNALKLQDDGWKILNKRWALFFIGLAILNEIIWRTQSEEFWVNFKVWGMLPITFIFTAFQFNIINKYKIDE